MLTKRLPLVTIITIACVGYSIGAKNLPQICSTDYDYHRQLNKCFKFYKDNYKHWWFGRKHCQSEGGDLVIIRDEEKNAAIEEFARKYNVLETPFWLGLRENMNGPPLRWVDNKHGVSFEVWETGQPENDNPDVRICVASHLKQDSYVWFDVDCMKAFPYICEKDIDISSVCLHGYVANSQNSMCYKLQTEKNTFNDSRYLCQQEKGAHLVTISDTDTKDDIISLVDPSIKHVSRYWVGLERSDALEFKWIDGSLQTSDVILFDDPHVHCATLQFFDDQYIYSGSSCNSGFPSICQRNILSTSYPALDCPLGYSPYTSTNGWYTTCLMIVNFNPETWSNAKDNCSSAGAELFTFENDEYDFKSFVGKDGIGFENAYWDEHGSCQVYDPLNGNFMAKSCGSGVYPYICQHWGNIRVRINIDKVGSVINGDNSSVHFVNDVCRSPNGTTIFVLKNGTLMDFLGLMTNDDDINCADPNVENECCDEVTLSKPGLNQPEIEMKFPIDKLVCLPCLQEITETASSIEQTAETTSPIEQTAETTSTIEQTAETTSTIEQTTETAIPIEKTTETPSPIEQATETALPIEHATETSSIEQTAETTSPIEQITDTTALIEKETFDLLRNVSKPKNESAAPNKLCPCRCDSSKIDFNPSAEVLSEIIANIQKELKVETEKLSSKRNKKVSAKDSRNESRAIGYMGIAMCLVPFCLLVAIDISRIFQPKQ